MTVKTRANARAEGTGIWCCDRVFASTQAAGTRAVTGRACLQLKAVRAASPLRVLRRSTCRSNGDAARSFLFGPSLYFANKRRCLSFVNLVFLFEIYSMKFHALTGQILLGCLVPRPILGRARRLLEGSRGVWGGGPKETSEK